MSAFLIESSCCCWLNVSIVVRLVWMVNGSDFSDNFAPYMHRTHTCSSVYAVNMLPIYTVAKLSSGSQNLMRPFMIFYKRIVIKLSIILILRLRCIVLKKNINFFFWKFLKNCFITWKISRRDSFVSRYSYEFLYAHIVKAFVIFFISCIFFFMFSNNADRHDCTFLMRVWTFPSKCTHREIFSKSY